MEKNKNNGMSRRKFIGNVSLATAGITILPSHVVGGLGYVAPSAQGNYRDSLDLLTKNGDVDNVVDKEKEVARSLALMANRKVARRNERLLLQRGCQDSRSRES